MADDRQLEVATLLRSYGVEGVIPSVYAGVLRAEGIDATPRALAVAYLKALAAWVWKRRTKVER